VKEDKKDKKPGFYYSNGKAATVAVIVVLKAIG